MSDINQFDGPKRILTDDICAGLSDYLMDNNRLSFDQVMDIVNGIEKGDPDILYSLLVEAPKQIREYLETEVGNEVSVDNVCGLGAKPIVEENEHNYYNLYWEYMIFFNEDKDDSFYEIFCFNLNLVPINKN